MRRLSGGGRGSELLISQADVNVVPVEHARTLDRDGMVRLAAEPPPATAVFDCDGTLWSADAGSGFMRWSLEAGLVSREKTEWMDARYHGYLRGEVGEEAICGEMVQIYQGLREEEIRGAARAFIEHSVLPSIFPEMIELTALLRRQGADLWAVSSTCRWVIEEALAPFAIPAERVLAARVRVQDGVLTDELEAVPTDDGKAAALLGVGVPQPDAVFGNSLHDVAMLAMARRPVVVNPTPALRREAAVRGWPVFQP